MRAQGSGSIITFLIRTMIIAIFVSAASTAFAQNKKVKKEKPAPISRDSVAKTEQLTKDEKAAKNDSISYVQPFSKASAFRTWSIGLNGGIMVPYNNDYTRVSYKQPGVSLYFKKQFLSSLAMQLNITAGQAIGFGARDNSISQYKTQFASGDLSFNLTLANINWRSKRSVVQPYLTVGFGYMLYQPVIYSGNPVVYRLYQQPGNGIIKSTFVPVGAGLKINLTRGINLDLGYTVYFVNTDNFDGLVYGGRNDQVSYMHIGLEFALGGHKKPQLATHDPVNSMRTEYLSIEKGLILLINKQRDEIEKLKGAVVAQGILTNSTNQGLIRYTTDSDGDGVPDLFDKCPNTPVSTVVDGAGCPLNIAAISPSPTRTPIRISPSPVQAKKTDANKAALTDQDSKVVKAAVDDLQFDFGNAVIKPGSYQALNDLAQLLKQKGTRLKLSGYTDNMGPDDVNIKLSKARAESIKNYLVKKGVNRTKIEANGYGKDNPIAPNNTEEGRTQNRRVEFELQ